ncbi:hypothetical protein [Bacillus atrophaeus]|uniref:hypothetical protein n=1 Tax=Bacillus atrophaeus TaxID=1452 RepID=UPI00227EBDA9|nr:hypothetical protein [Bacillus atrophaeus]MCY8466538.1 hypothetical protein [Bacillus atrophaeus]MCY8478997.1 hypothetical protein [Bacillus atrophaeus]
MSNEQFDKVYGSKGIDTLYERETITYRPVIKYEKDQLAALIREETQQSIERSRTFMISSNLFEYDELISEVDKMLNDIELRNTKDLISSLKSLLESSKVNEVIAFEREQCGYKQTGDFELYTLLYNMKQSMQFRRDFLDERFRTQITDETELEEIEKAESSSIDEWEQFEAQVNQAYQNLSEHEEDDDHYHPLDDDSLSYNIEHLTYEELQAIESKKRNKEIFHTSMADTSYIHRNRYFMFLEIIEKAKTIVYDANSLIDHNLKDFILSLAELGNLSSAKAHLILQFKSIKEKHEALKGRMMTIDDEKENFASEKQYMYQQLETKTIEPLKEWLYNQEEEVSGALDIFSGYIVNSMQNSRSSYETSIADMLNFYQSEASFYEEQISYIKNKEEIRKFYRILEDLGEATNITNEWVEEYLKLNRYSV